MGAPHFISKKRERSGDVSAHMGMAFAAVFIYPSNPGCPCAYGYDVNSTNRNATISGMSLRIWVRPCNFAWSSFNRECLCPHGNAFLCFWPFWILEEYLCPYGYAIDITSALSAFPGVPMPVWVCIKCPSKAMSTSGDTHVRMGVPPEKRVWAECVLASCL